MELSVTSFGDDVRTVKLTDKLANISTSSEKTEGLLTTVLTNADQEKMEAKQFTRRGEAKNLIKIPSSQDVVEVQSLNRRGISMMNITLSSGLIAGRSLRIQCEKQQ